MEAIGRGVMSGLLAYSVHYGAIKTYSIMCVSEGVWGFIEGLVTAGSPVCQSLLTIASQSQVSYSAFILIGVTRVFVDLIPMSQEKN
jgi:hypothetical protein